MPYQDENGRWFKYIGIDDRYYYANQAQVNTVMLANCPVCGAKKGEYCNTGTTGLRGEFRLGDQHPERERDVRLGSVRSTHLAPKDGALTVRVED